MSVSSGFGNNLVGYGPDDYRVLMDPFTTPLMIRRQSFRRLDGFFVAPRIKNDHFQYSGDE